jgi:hypothetical protein
MRRVSMTLPMLASVVFSVASFEAVTETVSETCPAVNCTL